MRPRRIGFWYRLAVLGLKPAARALTRRDWAGAEHLPAVGGVIVAANHYSHADPIVVAHFLYDHGRLPRFLAKAELFSAPLVGAVMRGADQIPVHRDRGDAGAALEDAVAALRRGECVVIFPEGTTTRDPDRWPMRARTGVARLALASGAPVLPMAQWGARDLHDKATGWHLRRVRVAVRLGEPVDLSAYRGRDATGTTLHQVTEAVMAPIRAMVGELRGQPPPAQVWAPPLDAQRRSA